MRGIQVKSKKKGRLFVISAPSGAGKGTVIRRLLELRPELSYSVSVTTRLPRDGEIEGVSYYFVTRERFKEMIEHSDFFEYAEYVGEMYGTPKQPIIDAIENGKDIVLEIEVKGAQQVMSIERNAVTIFIVPPSIEELERRLRSRRTESEEKLAARLERAIQELEERNHYGYIVVNDKVSQAAAEISAIIDDTD